MNTNVLGVGAALLLLGCRQAPHRASGDDKLVTASAAAAAPTTTARKVAPLNPAIVAKAEEILRANPGAKFGTEFPFELDGRKYVARVEEHDNPDGDPRRPSGEHKGITVYSAD